MDVDQLRVVRLLHRLLPVTDTYEGPRMLTRLDGRRAVTPLALVVLTVLTTDVIFAPR